MIEYDGGNEDLKDSEGVEDQHVEDHVFDWDDPETGTTGMFTCPQAKKPATYH